MGKWKKYDDGSLYKKCGHDLFIYVYQGDGPNNWVASISLEHNAVLPTKKKAKQKAKQLAEGIAATLNVLNGAKVLLEYSTPGRPVLSAATMEHIRDQLGVIQSPQKKRDDDIPHKSSGAKPQTETPWENRERSLYDIDVLQKELRTIHSKKSKKTK